MKIRKVLTLSSLLLVAMLTYSCLNDPASSDNPQNTGIGYSVPAGRAYADGEEIRFTHTEISDPTTAVTLTNMMNSPVLVVPSLAQIPDSLLAAVYVFANGIKGSGPLKYQADVFDKPASSSDYTPLRRLYVVSWQDTTKAKILKSVTEIKAAESNNEITIEKKPVVINMPFIEWKGGKR